MSLQKSKYKENDLLYIQWIDSGYWAGWKDKDDVKSRIKESGFNEDCESTGFYIGEDKRLIVICLSKSGINYCDIMYIPKCSIKKIKVLKHESNN